jgi:hypothetical protein
MKRQPAAAILIVLASLALVSGLVLHVWFISSFYSDVAALRAQWYKSFYTTHTALTIGVKHIRDQFDALYKQCVKQQRSPDIYISGLGHNANDGQAIKTVVFVHKPTDDSIKNALMVTAQTYAREHCVCALRCILKKATINVDDKKENRFVVSHYSIGARV